MSVTLADNLALAALQAALHDARQAGDRRPALDVLSASLLHPAHPGRRSLHATRLFLAERDAFLHELHCARRRPRTVSAYRLAIDDLLTWARHERCTNELQHTHTIHCYLADYQQRCDPVPATYRHRFILLRAFMNWLTTRHAMTNPFDQLEIPPKTPTHTSEDDDTEPW